MSKIKVYPWPNVALDYFGQNAMDTSGKPTSEATQLSTLLCEALLTGELTARDIDGNPALKNFPWDSVTSLNGKYRYVYPDDVNDWLSKNGHLKKWTPSSSVDEFWKTKAKEHADVIWLRERSNGKKPTREAISREIEGKLKREGVVSATGKPISSTNILRNALADWVVPIVDEPIR